MGNFEAFIYGLVQGATEYLPVSSSAHLLLLPHILGSSDPGLAFDVFLHIGTLLATAAYFFKDWVQIAKTPVSKTKISWVHLIVGTLPAVVVGVLLNSWIKDNTRSLWILMVSLPLFGIILWWADKKALRDRDITQASVKDFFYIGCMQVLSLIPGVSRSGSTMTAARLLGFARGDSARISFLLSLPITLGAIVYEAKHWDEITASLNGVTPLLIGCLSAFLFGALAIHFLIKLVSKTSFAVFAVYRVIIGALIFLFLN